MSDLTPKQAARELCCSRTLVYHLIERGELPGTYELPGSKRKRIPRADLDALKELNRVRTRRHRTSRRWLRLVPASREVRGRAERERKRRSGMTIEQLPDGRYRLRWYVAGRGSPRRQTFPRGTRKKQVESFAANLEIRRAMGELALFEQRKRPVRDLSKEWWAKHAVPNLAEWTRIGYRRMLVKHIEPRLGSLPVGEVNPEIVADFRAQLEAAGVGRHSVRQSLVVLQAMYEQAIRWGWVATNPVKAVKKPAAKRERAVVCLAPSQVEAIRGELLARGKFYAATMVSLVAYQGLRAPEELLALEVRHVRRNTLLVEPTEYRR